jgi:zinc protease
MTEFNRYVPGLQAVTPAQITAALAGEVQPGQASIVIVGDAKAFLESLRARYPNLEVVPITELDLSTPTLRRAPTE